MLICDGRKCAVNTSEHKISVYKSQRQRYELLIIFHSIETIISIIQDAKQPIQLINGETMNKTADWTGQCVLSPPSNPSFFKISIHVDYIVLWYNPKFEVGSFNTSVDISTAKVAVTHTKWFLSPSNWKVRASFFHDSPLFIPLYSLVFLLKRESKFSKNTLFRAEGREHFNAEVPHLPWKGKMSEFRNSEYTVRFVLKICTYSRGMKARS